MKKDIAIMICLIFLSFGMGILFVLVYQLKEERESTIHAAVTEYLENHDFTPITE